MRQTLRPIVPVHRPLAALLLGLGTAAVCHGAPQEAVFSGTISSGVNNGMAFSFAFEYDIATTASSPGTYLFPDSSITVTIGSTVYTIPGFAIRITDGTNVDQILIYNTPMSSADGFTYANGTNFIELEDLTTNPVGVTGTGLDQIEQAAGRLSLFEIRAFQFYANGGVLFETGIVNDLEVTPSGVPEPSSAALLAALASLGFAAGRRRRARRA